MKINLNPNIQNYKNKSKDKGDLIDTAKSTVGEVAYNLATLPGDAAMLIQGAATLPISIAKKVTTDDPNYSILQDSFSDTLGEKFNENIVEPIAEKLGRKDYNELNSYEKAGRLAGDLIPSIGLTKAVKAGQVINNINKAKRFEEGTSGLIKLKTHNPSKYGASQFFLPGVQIDKTLPLSQQKLSLGLQTGIIGGINAYQNSIANEYNEQLEKQPNQIILKKDFRKNLNDPNNQIVFNLDEIKKQKEEENNYLLYAGGVAAALLGASAFYRKYSNIINKEVTKTVTDNADNISSLSKKMNAAEQLNTSVPDRFGFRHKLVDEGLLSEELSNDLAIDDSTKVNSMFETGNFGTITSQRTPQSMYDRLQSLKLSNPEEYQKFDDMYNFYSKIQDDAYRYNIYAQKGKTNYSTNEYIVKLLRNELNLPNNSYTTKEEYINKFKLFNSDEYLDTKTKLDLSDIDTINLKLLEYQRANNYISNKQFEDLLKNRYINNAGFIYKHIAQEVNDPIYKQLLKYAINETPYNPNALPNMNVRGPHGIDINNSKSIADVFEYQVKSTLMDVEKNNQKRNTIQYMLKQQNKRIDEFLKQAEENIDYVKTLTEKQKGTKRYEKVKEGYDNLVKDYAKHIKDMFYVKHIGTKKITSSPHESIAPTKLFDLLNTRFNPNNDLHKLLTNYDEGFGALDKYEGMSKVANDIVSFIDGDYIHYYKTDPIIAAAFNFNPTLPSKMAEMMKGMKNIVQSTITGQMNPTFALPSATMSLYEAFTMFPVIASKLNLLEPASRLQYMKQIGQTMREIVTTEHTKNLIRLYDREIMRNLSISNSPYWQLLRKNNIKKLRETLNKTLLTQVHDLGGGSLKPTTKNNGKFFTLNNNTKINDKLKKFIVDHYGLDVSVQMVKTLNYLQLALREGPQLALTEYFGKAKGAIKNGNIVDEKAMKQVIDVISEYTANIGKAGSGKGFLGGLSQAVSNYVPYGNIMIQSLSPKLRGSEINKGIGNFYKLCMNLFDPKVRYIDILTQIKLHGKELVQNKFLQGLLVTSFIPTLISYIWNYGSTENMESYHRMSDYDKSSKLILSNFLGKDNHLMIPKDQEVAVCDSIIYAFLDNMFGMSAYNKIDPAFDNSKLMMQSLARSIGIDSIPALDLIANLSGKEINLNMFDERFGINDLSRNNLNTDLSETAYKNGLVNQETTSMINSLFGLVGSALLTVGEEANVGSQNNTELNDAKQAFIDKFTKSGKLFGPKQISSFNETSKYVYNQRNLINKIASVEVKTPTQQQVYNFIKIYNKNRIKPIHDNITELRKDIQNVKSTGRTKSGKILDYNGRKATINNINSHLQELFAKEYHEFKNMDKLMQEQFGKGITLNTFMEKLQ